MSASVTKVPRFESFLAVVLNYGTLLASAIIALGFVRALLHWHAAPNAPAILSGMRIVMAGIACLIFLPVLRVVLMLIVFARRRDYRFVAIAATVLTIILLGFAIGIYMSKPLAG